MGYILHEPAEPMYVIPAGRDRAIPRCALPLSPALTEKPFAPYGLTPKPYRILQNIRAISACMHRNVAIDRDNTLWEWGAQPDDTLSDDAPQKVEYVPQRRMEQVLTAAAGGWHTLCVTQDHKLWGWGANDCGQLGLGDFRDRPEPVCIMEDVRTVCAAEDRSLVIKTDGSLWGFGANDHTLVDCTTHSIFPGAPAKCAEPVYLLPNVLQVSTNEEVVLAVCEDHTLWGWGQNHSGILFTEAPFRPCAPTQLLQGIRSAAVPAYSCDVAFGFVITDGGDLYVIGDGSSGALLSWQQRRKQRPLPVKLLRDVQAVFPGNAFSYVLMQDGRLLSSGWNDLGQCGTGRSTASFAKPKVIFHHVAAAAAGYYHGMALQTNGDLWIWGGDYGLPRSEE